MVVTWFTYAMNTIRKEERMSVKKTSKQQRGNAKFCSEIVGVSCCIYWASEVYFS